jgi:mannose-6-phosphate isomerase-like protein (cupin superfamily)
MWEFFLVLKGSGYGRVGRKRVRFAPGASVFIPPEVPHDFHTGRRALEALVIFSPPFDAKKPDVVPCGTGR